MRRRTVLAALGALPLLSAGAAPRFRDRWFPITGYPTVTAAVDACAAAGGGHVLVPAGRWETGPVRLRSGVDLHLAEGATLAFSTDPADYLPVVRTRWQGVEVWNYSPLIYAAGERDIAITGRGTLDAQGDNGHWWPWVGSGQYGWQPGMPNQRADWAALEAMGQSGVPVAERVFGSGHYLRPSFIQPYECRNVLIEGVTIRNSPMWTIHPVYCSRVTVRDVVVDNPGPNGDGCDPDSCTDVLIQRVTFRTHDDCIAIKSGRDADGRRVGRPSTRILIEDCTFVSGGGAVAVGSEMSGGVSDVLARGLRLPRDPEVDQDTVAYVLSVKSTSTRGGYIRDIVVRDVDCPARTYVPLEVTFQYMGGTGGTLYPEVSGLVARNWSVTGPCEYPIRIRAAETAPVRSVRLRDLTFTEATRAPLFSFAEDVVLQDVLVL
jgi:polygalacturonase